MDNIYRAKQLAQEIKNDWVGLGYGWSDSRHAKKTTLDLTDPKNGQQLGIENWGIEGKRHRDSNLYIIGVWANVLIFFYDAYFDNFSRPELDRLILWTQQDPKLLYNQNYKFVAEDEISKILIAKKNSPVNEVKEELKNLYIRDKKAFLSSQWSSLINAAGPEINIVNEQGEFIEIDKICDSLNQLRTVNLEHWTAVCNMAWLEEFYTRLNLPGMLYDHLNFDELLALYICMKTRDSLMVEDYLIRNQIQVDMSNGVSAVIAKIFEVLVYTFFEVVQNLNGKSGCDTWNKITRSSGHTPEISGILRRADHGIVLTGTGKELFYLLSKGATPIICGEGLFLTQNINSDFIKSNAIPTIKNQLANIDKNTKNALLKHYKYPEEKSYGKIFNNFFTSPFDSSLPDDQIIAIETLNNYFPSYTQEMDQKFDYLQNFSYLKN